MSQFLSQNHAFKIFTLEEVHYVYIPTLFLMHELNINVSITCFIHLVTIIVHVHDHDNHPYNLLIFSPVQIQKLMKAYPQLVVFL